MLLWHTLLTNEFNFLCMVIVNFSVLFYTISFTEDQRFLLNFFLNFYGGWVWKFQNRKYAHSKIMPYRKRLKFSSAIIVCQVWKFSRWPFSSQFLQKYMFFNKVAKARNFYDVSDSIKKLCIQLQMMSSFFDLLTWSSNHW